MATIGERIRAVRDEIQPKMTQGDLARILGLAQSAVSKWENDETRPDAVQIVRVAAALNCSIEQLVVGVDQTYDRLRSKMRDLARHEGARSSGLSRGPDVTAQDRVLAELSNAHDAFVRAVSDVADRLAGVMADEKARGPFGATRKIKADKLRRPRKVG